MKNFITRFAAWIILAVMFVMLLPGISLRISSEAQNNNVTVSFLYNNMINKLPEGKFDELLDEFKAVGITTVSVMEEDLNFLTLKGAVTSIKYNVLCHKYDQQSIEIAKIIKERCPDLSYDSHIVLISDEEKKEFFKYAMPRKFSSNDYAEIGTVDGLDIYVLYDGRKELWDYAIGYNENVISTLRDKGFEVALVYKVKNYEKTEHLKDVENIIKKYDIKFLNLKADAYDVPKEDQNTNNYKKLAKIINNNDMTLVVTENTDQLSNQDFYGYSYIFDKVVKDGGTQKVIRSYETYDDSSDDDSKYKYRTEQFFNSTLDRNLRFITVTLMEPLDVSYTDCAEYTLKAAKEYIEKIEQNGYTHTSEINKINYMPNKKLNSAICAVIMIMCVLIAYQMITGSKNFVLVIIALLISAIAFVASYIIPESLLSLYPTVYSVIHSCFAMTVLLYFLKTTKDKLSLPLLTFSAVVLMLGTLLIGAVGQGTLLSGISYYINTDIFRGIKLSLIVPVVYTACISYLMFIKKPDSDFLSDIKKVLNARIKVYWLLIGCVISAIGIYYIIRSGNVNTISSMEKIMRSTLTEIFPARPRTKEFLIGYPALVLLIYYIKNTNADIMKWILAIASSILAASISNSFCHVFTNFQTIVMRTINGLLVGILVSLVAFVANIILLKIVNIICKRLENTEMR